MAGRTKPPFRRRVKRPQRRRRWPRFDRNTKICGILVVPVLSILALLAVWVYVLQQTVREHVFYILDTDQSWLGLLAEAVIAIVLFGVLLKVVGLIPSEPDEVDEPGEE